MPNKAIEPAPVGRPTHKVRCTLFATHRWRLGIKYMSKHVTDKSADDGKLSEHEAQKLLGVLCMKYGFCLPPLWHARLERNPPRSIEKFLDTVFRAEGLDPIAADGGVYKAMREEVRLAFDRSKSGHEVPDA